MEPDSDDDELYPDDYYLYNDGSDEDCGIMGGTYCGFPSSFLYPHIRSNHQLTLPVITQEEADRNARELLEEERREKEKANKKREKKKKQKDRKRQLKLDEAMNNVKISDSDQDKHTNGNHNSGSNPSQTERDNEGPDLSEPDSEGDLDLRSTFVCKAKQKMENKPKPERKDRARERSQGRTSERSQDRTSERSQDREGERSQGRTSERSQDRTSERSQDRVSGRKLAAVKLPLKSPNYVQEKAQTLDRYQVQQSLDLANIGNNCANREDFMEAITYYTEAIKLNPTEFRFMGNRSYSYERSGKYKEALEDAEHALQLEPNFIKGYFRKGKALKGLKRYADAIFAFQKVLLCDKNHIEAACEIDNCHQMIQAMNSCTRVKVYNNSLLSPPLTPPGLDYGLSDDDYVTRAVGYTRSNSNPTLPTNQLPNHLSSQVPPAAPTSKLYPVWVGNMTKKITEHVLRSHFEPFGTVHSMRILYARTCAFVNYTNKQSAERAFYTLQGSIVEDTTFVLQLRNPEHSRLNAVNTGAK